MVAVEAWRDTYTNVDMEMTEIHLSIRMNI